MNMLAALLSVAASSFIITLIFTKRLISLLTRINFTVEDAHKPGRPQIPKPGGPAIIAGIIASECILYTLNSDPRILALMLVVGLTFIIGLIDDLYTLSGVIKPTLLILASLPILLLGAYSPYPVFPIFHTPVRLTIVYPILILAAIPITSNTFNSIDVLNGVVSSFASIAATPLLIALLLKGEYLIALASLPLITSSLAFYLYHRYPSRIFPGDSGSLSLGAMYGAIAIVGGVEVVGIIALLPAILNSFFFLSSVRRFVEHRLVKARPVVMLDDGRMAASKDPDAPITLVRLILAGGTLREREIALEIVKLTSVSALLAILTALTTWVV